MNETEKTETVPEMQGNEKKPKDYRKLSRVKTVIFLILAAAVLAGMYFSENPVGKTKAEPQGTEILRLLPKESGEIK